jgi:alkylhydroperoxidase family enzyme
MANLDSDQSYLESDEFTHREKIALRYCDAIIDNPMDADDELWELLHAEFTEPELVELGHYINSSRRRTRGGQRNSWMPHAPRARLRQRSR